MVQPSCSAAEVAGLLVIVQALWNQCHLTSILAFDEARHTDSPVRYVFELYRPSNVTVRGFSHRLDP